MPLTVLSFVGQVVIADGRFVVTEPGKT